MTCVISTRVKNIEIDDDKFILDTENGKYYSNIKKGSIKCSLYSYEKKILPLSYLEKDDLVELHIIDKKIINIFINIKYVFLSDSSDDDYVS